MGKDNLGALDHGFTGKVADVRGEEGVGRVEEGLCVGEGRFLVKDIHRRTGKKAIAEGLGQIGGVHNWAAGAVDENRGWFHLGKFAGSKKIFGFGGAGQVDRDDVGAMEEFVQGDVLKAEGFDIVVFGAIGADQVGAEGGKKLGNAFSDVAGADDADGAAGNFIAKEVGGAAAVPKGYVGFSQAAQEANGHAEDKLSNAFVRVAGGVDDLNALSFGLRHGHVIRTGKSDIDVFQVGSGVQDGFRHGRIG